MSATLELRREADGCIDRLTAYVAGEGRWLDLVVSDRQSDGTWQRSHISLPAADARRLLAWLRERYPETEDGK